MDDRFDLDRFVRAQAASHADAIAELRAGRKRSHWMWFVFPQIAGLGRSATARFYAIGSAAEARAYLGHPLLGARLREAVETIQALPATSADAVFGGIDAVKLRSSLTLFATIDPWFDAALHRWFGGVPDPATLAMLERG